MVLSFIRRIPEYLYRGRVVVLLILFIVAMEENGSHPYPLWDYGLRLILLTPDAFVTTWDRRAAMLIPLLLYAVSLYVRLSATASLGPLTVWSRSPKTQDLVQRGLYSAIRHPLYLGSVGMILSLSLMSSIPGALILSGLGLPFLIFLARYEEAAIAGAHPEYGIYRQKVPAIWPGREKRRTFLRESALPLVKNIGYALRSEAPNVALFAGFVAFWITPDLKFFWIFFGVTLLASFAAPHLFPPGKP